MEGPGTCWVGSRLSFSLSSVYDSEGVLLLRYRSFSECRACPCTLWCKSDGAPPFCLLAGPLRRPREEFAPVCPRPLSHTSVGPCGPPSAALQEGCQVPPFDGPLRPAGTYCGPGRPPRGVHRRPPSYRVDVSVRTQTPPVPKLVSGRRRPTSGW